MTEFPVYLQFLIGVGVSVCLLWSALCFEARRFVFGWLLLVASSFFGLSGFSAIGFGCWRSWWTFRWLGL